jgi:glyoxylase-like metal-dependent hydrolase (beta-lactamase superfamily II)
MKTLSSFRKKLSALLATAIVVSTFPVGLALTGCSQNGGIAVSADIFTRRVGDVEVSLLCERQQEGSPGILIGATPEILQKTAPNSTFPNAINAFLIKFPADNDHAIYTLVDTGFGTKLFDNLKTLNVKPEKIANIYLTHMHGDHIGGLLRSDGSLAFPNAQVFLNKLEHDYWISLAAGKETPQSKVIAAYQKVGKLHVDTMGTNLNNDVEKAVLLDEQYLKPKTTKTVTKLPNGLTLTTSKSGAFGLQFIKTYGHTPGHTAYLILSQGERLLIWGDLAHAMAVQMPYPQVSVTYDVDPVQAAKSRRLVLDFITENNIPVAGMHIAYPGMGIVTKDKEVPGGYKFEAFKPNKK